MDFVLYDIWTYGKWGALVYLVTLVVERMRCRDTSFPWLLHLVGFVLMIAAFTAYGVKDAPIMDAREQDRTDNINKIEQAGYSYLVRLDGHPHPGDAVSSCDGDVLFADHMFNVHSMDIDVEADQFFVVHVFCKEFLKKNTLNKDT